MSKGKSSIKPVDQSIRGDAQHVAMKPRRGLFVLLAVVLGVWIVYLLGLYFMTVYPLRHETGGVTTTAPAVH